MTSFAFPRKAVQSALFALAAVLALTPFATPALALGLGVLLALTVGNPWTKTTATLATRLLQVAVVGLGLGIPVENVIRAGTRGVALTAVFIAIVFAVGLRLGRWLRLERDLSMLVTAGTSICGGSAVAALGSAIGASREAMSVAMATVFVLNGVALYVFPPIGTMLHLTQHQFAIWAALAIHDTSSVVGAAASYGPQALQEATVLKLARALWIIPLVLIAVRLRHRSSGTDATEAVTGAGPTMEAEARRAIKIPWFIGLFLLAAVLRSVSSPANLHWFDLGARAARSALVLTLFLIGANLTRAQIKAVGMRPFLHGVLLWIGVGSVTLAAVVMTA